MMPRHKAFLAVALAAFPLAGCAGQALSGSPACQANPYAGTQAANQALNVAQQANMAAMQARYGLGAGIGGMIGTARGVLATVQTAQRPVTPPCPAAQRR